MTDAHRGKPQHLAAEYAAQFGDEAIAAVYRHRPPYPPQTFSMLEPLLGPPPRCVLELGAGTGDFTVGLAPRAETLIALEPSEAMLARARRREIPGGAHVQWLALAAEEYAFDRDYSAVVAAEAFHWLDWHRVLPHIAARLAPHGHLILVERTLAESVPWDRQLRALIREYSTNRDYVPYDLVSELETRGLIAVRGQARTDTMWYRQSIESYVESFHSRNGFSRARLGAARAGEFDDKLETLVGDHCSDGTVSLPVQARIVWGRPIVT